MPIKIDTKNATSTNDEKFLHTRYKCTTEIIYSLLFCRNFKNNIFTEVHLRVEQIYQPRKQNSNNNTADSVKGDSKNPKQENEDLQLNEITISKVGTEAIDFVKNDAKYMLTIVPENIALTRDIVSICKRRFSMTFDRMSLLLRCDIVAEIKKKRCLWLKGSAGYRRKQP